MFLEKVLGALGLHEPRDLKTFVKMMFLGIFQECGTFLQGGQTNWKKHGVRCSLFELLARASCVDLYYELYTREHLRIV